MGSRYRSVVGLTHRWSCLSVTISLDAERPPPLLQDKSPGFQVEWSIVEKYKTELENEIRKETVNVENHSEF